VLTRLDGTYGVDVGMGSRLFVILFNHSLDGRVNGAGGAPDTSSASTAKGSAQARQFWLVDAFESEAHELLARLLAEHRIHAGFDRSIQQLIVSDFWFVGVGAEEHLVSSGRVKFCGFAVGGAVALARPGECWRGRRDIALAQAERLIV